MLCRQPNADEWNMLQSGDLVFCVGHSFKSSAVRWLSSDQSTISHVGFIMKSGDNSGMMCHMSADDKCIAKEFLESYIQKSNVTKLLFYRLPSLVDTVRLGYVLDSLWEKRIPFDDSFNYESNDKLYCTEFVIKTLQQAGNPDFDRINTEKHIYPSDLIQQGKLIPLFEVSNPIQ